VTIWVVRYLDDLFVRSSRGATASWFRAAEAGREGRISAGGVAKDVVFVPVSEPGVNNAIDVAYRAKYGRSRYAHSDGDRARPLDHAETRSARVARRKNSSETRAAARSCECRHAALSSVRASRLSARAGLAARRSSASVRKSLLLTLPAFRSTRTPGRE
jgi:hypothetical protein